MKKYVFLLTLVFLAACEKDHKLSKMEEIKNNLKQTSWKFYKNVSIYTGKEIERVTPTEETFILFEYFENSIIGTCYISPTNKFEDMVERRYEIYDNVGPNKDKILLALSKHEILEGEIRTTITYTHIFEIKESTPERLVLIPCDFDVDPSFYYSPKDYETHYIIVK